ncbi:tRNA (adenosine(37)-N6)-threonylcarbamoyltransferase complex dimerization subunit type 1 TsaB [Bifidobacterium xylocopae]|uniref:tRNA (Adenosine(37)-N6)-threonylcarbamoyltransferase complex dimerization subunit type 1 TsaB n=1 Tax=Bifidobacterium xylocopae TaxID=2493119 RepID=A0A366KC98_9BIFI|nr:tRNA (adenosine(37)-N6)-threonylcarbamoyltransferase complex dimerization subunit type 1 TsaB [Bifidobacterium xylocopae]RBP98987.1 tRNA (adenosine(37)-N6)-threonylcarbamoyltransferase complex dimerization subunit type 1 TsaB [Bifidobacterium xylocopae]
MSGRSVSGRKNAPGGRTLVIDTSYGLAVGLDGFAPLLEEDSHQHVELLLPTVDRLLKQEGLAAGEIDSVVVGVGPGPFTGLRTGIVAAKALAFATGARLLGQDILSAQAEWTHARASATEGEGAAAVPRRLTLAVNDARRRQLYFELFDTSDSATEPLGHPLIDMDIDYPDSLVERVNRACVDCAAAHPGIPVLVDVAGRGVDRYRSVWAGLDHPGLVSEDLIFHGGAAALGVFVARARRKAGDQPIEPLYLRRPDVSVPNPLKHVVRG